MITGMSHWHSALIATFESRKDKNDQQHLYDKGLKLPLRYSRALQDRPPLQIRTIIYDEAALYSMCNHVLGTRFLSSRNDSHNNFSGTLRLR
jgi:hypothetical protein